MQRELSAAMIVAEVQWMLSSFGGSYKRSADCKREKRCQDLVYKNAGLTECDEMWGEVLACFGVPFTSPDSAGMEKYMSNVLAATWKFGLEAESYFLSLTPNGLACARLLSCGEITVAMYELQSLIPALKIMWDKDTLSMSEFLERFKTLTAAQAVELSENGCPTFLATQKPGQVLVVPTGWVLCEMATSRNACVRSEKDTSLPGHSSSGELRHSDRGCLLRTANPLTSTRPLGC